MGRAVHRGWSTLRTSFALLVPPAAMLVAVVIAAFGLRRAGGSAPAAGPGAGYASSTSSRA
ncbi:hypothetical protein ACFV5N_10615 [Streptomyces sp. NPDC059853]|uniref:hypothetical protein n=1 Tax=Streptomyces sp. NPDC059853 TaxID=3346973 RepID=UPI003660E72C